MHGGEEASVRFVMVGDSGPTRFVRNGTEFLPDVGHLEPQCRRATDLRAGSMLLRTVEHFLAALCAVGLPPVRVEVDGPELPILDGSAEPVFQALVRGGLSYGFCFVELAQELEVTLGQSRARLRPVSREQPPRITARLQLGLGAPTFDPICFLPTMDDFAKDIAPARTFCRWEDVELLREAGLIRGGTLDCALVLDKNGPMAGQKYRLPGEPVRHKILDAIGDLSLLGGLPWADIELEGPGHGLLHEVVRQAASLVRTPPWFVRSDTSIAKSST